MEIIEFISMLSGLLFVIMFINWAAELVLIETSQNDRERKNRQWKFRRRIQ